MIFGKISQFSYFSGINPALTENPIFYILMFQGPKRRLMTGLMGVLFSFNYANKYSWYPEKENNI